MSRFISLIFNLEMRFSYSFSLSSRCRAANWSSFSLICLSHALSSFFCYLSWSFNFFSMFCFAISSLSISSLDITCAFGSSSVIPRSILICNIIFLYLSFSPDKCYRISCCYSFVLSSFCYYSCNFLILSFHTRSSSTRLRSLSWNSSSLLSFSSTLPYSLCLTCRSFIFLSNSCFSNFVWRSFSSSDISLLTP